MNREYSSMHVHTANYSYICDVHVQRLCVWPAHTGGLHAWLHLESCILHLACRSDVDINNRLRCVSLLGSA